MLKLFKNFWIQSKDVRIAKFSFDEFGFVSEVEYLENGTHFADLIDFRDQDVIDQWLAKRLLPMNRENGARLLQNNRLSNIRIVASNQYFLSLSDTFWLNPIEEDRKWDEVSLYQNNVDVDLFELALYGEGISGKTGLTPEYTTGGHLAKGWLYDDGIWKLKKGAGYYPGEPLSEVLAYEIAAQLGFDCVKYEYEERVVKDYPSDENFREDQRLAMATDVLKSYSSCNNFSSEEFSFLPDYNLSGNLANKSSGEGRLANQKETQSTIGKLGFSKKFEQMEILDALTFNNDRHHNNFGFMFDSNTGKIADFAPIFDTGQSLFYRTPDEFLPGFETVMDKTRDMCTKMNFIDTLKFYDINISSSTFEALDLSKIGTQFDDKFPERMEAVRKAVDIQVGRIKTGVGGF